MAYNSYGTPSGYQQQTTIAHPIPQISMNMNDPTAPTQVISLADAWLQLEGASAQNPIEEVGAIISDPLRVDGSNKVSITRELIWKHSPAELASNPDLLTKTFKAKGIKFDELKQEGIKLVPEEIVVTMKQNGLPFAVGIHFNQEGRKTLKVNSNTMLSPEFEEVDVVVPEGAHSPMLCNTQLYTSTRVDAFDIRPFEGMHSVSKEELREGILHMDTAPGGDSRLAYADVVVKSPIQQIVMNRADQFHLDGSNVVNMGVQYDKLGNAYEVNRIPLHVANKAISWADQMIDQLPFQDPEELVATMVRLDGRPFDELEEHDKVMDGLNTRVPVHVTIEERYIPFRFNEDHSLAVTNQ